MTSTSLISRLLLALALAGLLGCKQERGDTCIEDDDCSGALVCCKSSAVASERGMCLPEEETCVDSTEDMGPPPVEDDMGTETDMGEALDMGEELDMGEADDGGPEDMGAAEDGGPEDMGAADDGGAEDLG